MPVAMVKEGVKYYLIYDQVGSLRLVADAAGNVVKSIEYDSFGNVLTDSNLSFEIPFGFSGGLHDRDTGLVRFGYRDYDPDVGRWTAKDPIFFAGGDTDLYGYVLNDPVNLIDPAGKYGVGGAIIGGIAGGYGGFLSGIQSGNITAGIIGGVAGAVGGSLIGAIFPQASSAVGGIIGGAISGAFGGAVGGSVSKALSDPCASVGDIGWAATKGAGVGAFTGAIGGGLSGAAAAVGLGAPTAVGAAGEMISAPIGWGLGMIE
jgi:RHS repeat-associated protein